MSLLVQAQRVNVALLLRYIWYGVSKGIVLLRQVLIIKAKYMKKVIILLAVMVVMGLSAFAAPRPIRVVQKPSEDSEAKKGRSIVILPTASIDGQVLTIEFCEAAASQVIVKGQSTRVVVYNG